MLPVIITAQHEAGVHEEGGNNCGARVEEYLASVGLPKGNPWCAAFVAWCFHSAGYKGWPATGDTWAIRTWALSHKCYNIAAQEGDVFLLLDHHGDPMHTGFVVSISNGMVHTVEGNTGGQSDTDGDGVHRKARPVGDCRYVHWQDVLVVPKPALSPKVTIRPTYTKAQIEAMLGAAALKHRIPVDVLKAAAWQESKWDPYALSFDGQHGKGVMQIDDRFHDFASTPDVFDPQKNIEYGAALLSNLHTQYGGWTAACQHYNGNGPAAEQYAHTVMKFAQTKPWEASK